jgi:glycosyltransferase involved in cell wall biosynthesis
MNSSTSHPHISVVVTTYSLTRYDDFCECIDSILAQSYDAFDVVIVAEGETVSERITTDYETDERVHVNTIKNGQNLATARNTGAEAATGEVVAFIDDDAVARVDWLEEIARGYTETDFAAVGGRAVPEWTGESISFLPEEFYFLIGATHRGFADGEGEVRNTFGCNISFNREVFLSLDGFSTNLGKDHGHNLQSEETELCARLRDQTGRGVYYVPSATVEHKVYPQQTTLRWLVNRAYWQGVSKAIVDESASNATDEEWGFVRYLLTTAVPHHTRQSITTPGNLPRLATLVGFTVTVGLGFAWGKIAI